MKKDDKNLNNTENQKPYESDGFFDDIPDNGGNYGDSYGTDGNRGNGNVNGAEGFGNGGNYGNRDNCKAAKKRTTASKIMCVVLAVLMFFVTFFAGYVTYHFTARDEVKNVDEILRLIDAVAYDYTEKGVENPDLAVKYFVRGLLSYDDYAEYYGKDEFEELMRESEGSYSGIGMTFAYNAEGKVGREIYTVIGNSPAARAGLKSGDILAAARKVGDEEFTELPDGEAAFAFLQKIGEGESAEFTVLRGENTFNVTLKRASYVATYVFYRDAEGEIIFNYDGEGGSLDFTENAEGKEALERDTAYIALASFEGGAAEQLKAALAEMKRRGKTKLIFDLRANGGGYMDVLKEIVELLVKAEGNIIYSHVKEKGKDTTFTTRSKYDDFLKHIVVLADGGTASASECLIGTMLSYGDKEGGNGFSASDVLVGYNARRGDYSTYGKGIMQTTYMLSSGGALKLTTAKIFWADGETCIHGVGVKPVSEANEITEENAISRAREILAAKN